jgi:multidrug resistance efflux pump
VLGYVAAANPRLLDASLAVIRAEVGMLSASMAGATDQQRVALEYERMAIDWMGRRIDRAGLKAKLQQAEAQIAYSEPLLKSGLITQESFRELNINREGLVAQIAELDKLIERLEPVFRDRPVSKADLSGETALAAAIKVQDAKLKLAEEELAPQPLVAPIDGVVTLLMRRAGEAVVVGETILRLTAAKPDRLAGFLMQPISFEPKPGMKAQIRTRGMVPKVAATTVTNVGVALEPISPALIAAMRLPPNPAPETALRIEFALPTGFNLRPGEHVDILLQ